MRRCFRAVKARKSLYAIPGGLSINERKLREVVSDLKASKCDGICFTSDDPEFGNHFIGVEWSDL